MTPPFIYIWHPWRSARYLSHPPAIGLLIGLKKAWFRAHLGGQIKDLQSGHFLVESCLLSEKDEHFILSALSPTTDIRTVFVKILKRLSLKGPIISEDTCCIFQLPKKYSVFLSLACWCLSFEFSRTFLESVSKSWGFQLSSWGLNSDFQWIWQMICLICW